MNYKKNPLNPNPQEHRVKYNQRYSNVFGRDPAAMAAIEQSEIEPPLAKLVDRWLERTPGLEENGFNFWGKYKHSVENLLKTEEETAHLESNEKLRNV